jgi:hypothetical protein
MTAEVTPPDISVAELEKRWGLSRNGLKARARALGVELIRVSSTRTVWPGDFVELGDALDAHIKSGEPLASFPGLAPDAKATSKAITKPEPSAELAAVVAAAIAQTASGPDPMRRARALAEAADGGYVLTSDEVAALGVKGIDGFADGDLAYGYIWRKHSQRNRTLWTVERAIAARPALDSTMPSLPAATSPKARVGFDVAAALTIDAIVLPSFKSSL